MKKQTLALGMVVVSLTLSGCGQGGAPTEVVSIPTTNNNSTNSSVGSTGTGNVGTVVTDPIVKGNGTRALVYKGPGACTENCAESSYDMAIRSGLSPTYVGPKDINANSSAADIAAMFKDVAVWIQPGGVSSTVLNNMTSQFVAALKNYVSNGGGYVGFCAGAFSSTKKVGTTSITGFNIFPGRTILYSSSPSSAAILPIQWNGKTRQIYWEGGPYITDLPAGAEAIATYPTGQVATARAMYGSGKVFITGLHPEAPQSWRNYYGINDSDGVDFDLVDEMINWVR